MRWSIGVVTAAVLLLSACGGHKSRPTRADGGRVRSAAAARHADGRFHDNLNQPQSRRYRDSNDSVPGGPAPDISKLAEPVPKAEPRSLYGNKSPYTVRGKSYRVLPTARGYVQRGLASFYGNKFHGYKTSDLENYDMYKFSAASKTLPLPSYARVTNLENGKSVIVRVNDRGPFVDGRIIDLSYVAAVKIGIWPKGTGRVEVRGIDPGHPDTELPPAPVVTAGDRKATDIYLQVGAFADAGNAARLAERLRGANLAPVRVERVQVDGRGVSRVRIGPLAGADRADQVSDRIERMGLPRPVAVD